MIRCNGCDKTFNSEDELMLISNDMIGTFKVCPNCNMDAFLMDIDPLDELYELVSKEDEGIKLTQKENDRYLELFKICHNKGIEIPFGFTI